MLNLGDTVVLENNQDPEKEAGKAVRELKLVPMMCKKCDKHYGRFHRLYAKVSNITRTMKPDKADDGDESDSSSFSNPVESVAIKANGSTATRKRKRSPLEEGKKDIE